MKQLNLFTTGVVFLLCNIPGDDAYVSTRVTQQRVFAGRPDEFPRKCQKRSRSDRISSSSSSSPSFSLFMNAASPWQDLFGGGHWTRQTSSNGSSSRENNDNISLKELTVNGSKIIEKNNNNDKGTKGQQNHDTAAASSDDNNNGYEEEDSTDNGTILGLEKMQSEIGALMAELQSKRDSNGKEAALGAKLAELSQDLEAYKASSILKKKQQQKNNNDSPTNNGVKESPSRVNRNVGKDLNDIMSNEMELALLHFVEKGDISAFADLKSIHNGLLPQDDNSQSPKNGKQMAIKGKTKPTKAARGKENNTPPKKGAAPAAAASNKVAPVSMQMKAPTKQTTPTEASASAGTTSTKKKWSPRGVVAPSKESPKSTASKWSPRGSSPSHVANGEEALQEKLAEFRESLEIPEKGSIVDDAAVVIDNASKTRQPTLEDFKSSNGKVQQDMKRYQQNPTTNSGDTAAKSGATKWGTSGSTKKSQESTGFDASKSVPGRPPQEPSWYEETTRQRFGEPPGRQDSVDPPRRREVANPSFSNREMRPPQRSRFGEPPPPPQAWHGEERYPRKSFGEPPSAQHPWEPTFYGNDVGQTSNDEMLGAPPPRKRYFGEPPPIQNTPKRRKQGIVNESTPAGFAPDPMRATPFDTSHSPPTGNAPKNLRVPSFEASRFPSTGFTPDPMRAFLYEAPRYQPKGFVPGQTRGSPNDRTSHSPAAGYSPDISWEQSPYGASYFPPEGFATDPKKAASYKTSNVKPIQAPSHATRAASTPAAPYESLLRPMVRTQPETNSMKPRRRRVRKAMGVTDRSDPKKVPPPQAINRASANPIAKIEKDDEERTTSIVAKDNESDELVENTTILDRAPVSIWDTSFPVAVQGNSLRTFSFESDLIERVQVFLKTDGHPLNANVDLWHGPDDTPQKMTVYLEDGSLHTFSTVMEAPVGHNSVAIENAADVGSHLLAAVVGSDFGNGSHGLGPLSDKLSEMEPEDRVVEAGDTKEYPFDSNVSSVQVLIRNYKRPLHARVELLQGPKQNVKQVVEIYTEDGLARPFYIVMDTPGEGLVVRVVNTGPEGFPMDVAVEPYTVLDDSGTTTAAAKTEKSMPSFEPEPSDDEEGNVDE